MDEHSAAGKEAKAANIHRSGAGDMDVNTTVQTSVCGSSIAEGNESQNYAAYERAAATTNVLDSVQGAQLSLLATKSPKSYIYKAYDKNKRTRSFIPHWVVEYPWLEFNPDKECMFCMYCREYQRTHDQEFTNTFVHGATNFRLDSVKAHDHSTKHRQVMLVMTGKLASIPKVPGKPNPKGPSVAERLRIGAFFSPEHDTQDDMSLASKLPNAIQVPDKLSEEHALQRHSILPSSDLTEEPVYTPNPMANYLQTLHGLYPSASLGEMDASEPRPSTSTSLEGNLPPATSTLHASSVVSSGLQHLKDEPISPKEASHQENLKRKQDEEDAEEEDGEEREDDGRVSSSGSLSLPDPNVIGKMVPRMKPVWQTGREEEGEEDEEDEGRLEAGNTSSSSTFASGQEAMDQATKVAARHHRQDQGITEGGPSQRYEDMADYIFDPSVAMVRQGKRMIRQLPRSKRRKLEKLIAQQMYENEFGTTDDTNAGDGLILPAMATESDYPWRQLAESFALKYQQLSEEHAKELKSIQDTVTNLEKKCQELEAKLQDQTKSVASSSTGEETQPQDQSANLKTKGEPRGTSGPSPRINMYSSVVILQVPGGEPVRLGKNSSVEVDSVQRDLAQSGIHINLSGTGLPNIADAGGEPPGPTLCSSRADARQNTGGVVVMKNASTTTPVGIQTEPVNGLPCDEIASSSGSTYQPSGHHSGVKFGRKAQLEDALFVQTNGESSLSNDKAGNGSSNNSDDAVVTESLQGSLTVSTGTKLPEVISREPHSDQATVPIKSEDLPECSESEDLVIDAIAGGVTDETAVPDAGVVT